MLPLHLERCVSLQRSCGWAPGQGPCWENILNHLNGGDCFPLDNCFLEPSSPVAQREQGKLHGPSLSPALARDSVEWVLGICGEMQRKDC